MTTGVRGAPRPNIVLMMGDDVGWADYEVNDPSMATPAITALAQRGLTLNQSYTLQTCTPTRSALLSGSGTGNSGTGEQRHWTIAARNNSGTGEQRHGTIAARNNSDTGEQRHGRNSGTGGTVSREEQWHRGNSGTGEQWHGTIAARGNSGTGGTVARGEQRHGRNSGSGGTAARGEQWHGGTGSLTAHRKGNQISTQNKH
ncbi:hypothetical protein ACOMHN_040332 [Nucella lapillus]